MDSAEGEYRCFVGGLAWATDEQSLGRTFSEFGEVLDSKVRLRRPGSELSDPALFFFLVLTFFTLFLVLLNLLLCFYISLYVSSSSYPILVFCVIRLI